MLEKLRLVEERYLEMAERAGQPDFYADPKLRPLESAREDGGPLIAAYLSCRKTEKKARRAARECWMRAVWTRLKTLCQEEYTASRRSWRRSSRSSRFCCCRATRTTIRASLWKFRGGVEASALLPTACTGCIPCTRQSKGWKVTLLNYNETELGGVKEADF